jgi:hypothetical protein
MLIHNKYSAVCCRPTKETVLAWTLEGRGHEILMFFNLTEGCKTNISYFILGRNPGYNGGYILYTFIRHMKKLMWFQECLFVTYSVFPKLCSAKPLECLRKLRGFASVTSPKTTSYGGKWSSFYSNYYSLEKHDTSTCLSLSLSLSHTHTHTSHVHVMSQDGIIFTW